MSDHKEQSSHDMSDEDRKFWWNYWEERDRIEDELEKWRGDKPTSITERDTQTRHIAALDKELAEHEAKHSNAPTEKPAHNVVRHAVNNRDKVAVQAKGAELRAEKPKVTLAAMARDPRIHSVCGRIYEHETLVTWLTVLNKKIK